MKMKYEIIEKPGVEDCVIIEQNDDAPAEKWEFKILEKKGKVVTAFMERKQGQIKWRGLKHSLEDEKHNIANLAFRCLVIDMLKSV